MTSSSVRRPLHLQGPRPSPLVVSKNSLKIKKSSTSIAKQNRSPVIVYLKSPDVIHVRPEEFMGLVQRLTGKQPETVTTISSTSPTSCARVADEAITGGSSVIDVGQQKFDSKLVAYSHLCVNPYNDWC